MDFEALPSNLARAISSVFVHFFFFLVWTAVRPHQPPPFESHPYPTPLPTSPPSFIFTLVLLVFQVATFFLYPNMQFWFIYFLGFWFINVILYTLIYFILPHYEQPLRTFLIFVVEFCMSPFIASTPLPNNLLVQSVSSNNHLRYSSRESLTG